jgi:integrase
VAVRRRGSRWVADFYDATRRRIWQTFDTQSKAREAEAKGRLDARQATRPAVDPNVTFEAYSGRWLVQIAASVKASTRDGYDQRLRIHLLPAFGPFKLRHLDRGRIRALLAEKLASGLAPDSVRLIHATLRAVLNAAVDDGVLLANPAARLGKALHLHRSRSARQEQIKAFDLGQLARFLAAIAEKHARCRSLFFTMSRTGLRIGEALALQWGDLDFEAREIRVERAISNTGVIDSPKSGHGRTVDMGLAVRDVLQRHGASLAEGWLKRKPERDDQGNEIPKVEMPPWVFPSEAWKPQDHANVGKVFRRALKHAGLPMHYSPHSLRHTYASLLLADGVSPAYVQEQLGHASIELTVGTYGRWLRKRAPGAVDRLDQPVLETSTNAVVAGHAEGPNVPRAAHPSEPLGSNLVANTASKASKGRLRQRKLLRGLVTRLGLEPRTQRLRVSCSTN